MSTVTRIPIVRIGDAATIRIPQIWLDRLAPDHEIEMVLEEDQLIIRPVRRPDAAYQPLPKTDRSSMPKPPSGVARLDDDACDAWDV